MASSPDPPENAYSKFRRFFDGSVVGAVLGIFFGEFDDPVARRERERNAAREDEFEAMLAASEAEKLRQRTAAAQQIVPPPRAGSAPARLIRSTSRTRAPSLGQAVLREVRTSAESPGPTNDTLRSTLPAKPLALSDGSQLDVYYLDDYYPTRDHRHSSHAASCNLLRLKDDERAGINYFATRLSRLLARGTLLIPMPGHSIGPASGGLRSLVRHLSQSGHVDGTICLERLTTVNKSAGAVSGARPTAEIHRASMHVPHPLLVRGRHVVLLDDVVTRGCSMRGATYHLRKAGAASVICLALTRTVSDRSDQSGSEDSAP